MFNPICSKFLSDPPYSKYHEEIGHFCKTHKVYSAPCQTSRTGDFMKIVNGFQPLTIFAKSTILHVLKGFWTRLWNYPRKISIIWICYIKWLRLSSQVPFEWPSAQPLGKITCRGRPEGIPEKRSDVFRTSIYGPICKVEGPIRSGKSLGCTQDVNFTIIHKMDFM